MQYQGEIRSSAREHAVKLTLRHQYTRAHKFRSSLCLRGFIM